MANIEGMVFWPWVTPLRDGRHGGDDSEWIGLKQGPKAGLWLFLAAN